MDADVKDRLDELEGRIEQLDDTLLDVVNDLIDANADVDPDEVVERYDTGASAEVVITRGTGTRDQEKWKLKGKGRNREDAMQELTEQVAEVVGGITNDEPLADQVRDFDPAREDAEADD